MTSHPPLYEVAARVVWWQPAEDTLANPQLFLSHLMAKGTLQEVAKVIAIQGLDSLREVIGKPYPGIFDAQSWAFWHVVLLGQSPPPPLPTRRLG